MSVFGDAFADAFVWRALAAGLGVSLIAAPLGCFVVWRRMAYFGDTLAHAALLGVALGVVLNLSPVPGVLIAALGTGMLLVALQRHGELASDTVLGILAHSTLALGVLVLALVESVRVNLVSYLFGDILAVFGTDLVWIFGGVAVGLSALALLWRPLLAVTVHADLARVEGVPATAVQLAFVALLAIVVAIAMRIVGILLITSLLVIPPATARRFARTPLQMAALATVAAAIAVAAGLGASLTWDTPAGPSMVVASALLFVASLAIRPAGARG